MGAPDGASRSAATNIMRRFIGAMGVASTVARAIIAFSGDMLAINPNMMILLRKLGHYPWRDLDNPAKVE